MSELDPDLAEAAYEEAQRAHEEDAWRDAEDVYDYRREAAADASD